MKKWISLALLLLVLAVSLVGCSKCDKEEGETYYRDPSELGSVKQTGEVGETTVETAGEAQKELPPVAVPDN